MIRIRYAYKSKVILSRQVLHGSDALAAAGIPMEEPVNCGGKVCVDRPMGVGVKVSKPSAYRPFHDLHTSLSLHAADPASARLQRLHDVRLVWPSALQGSAALRGHSRELGDRLHRILHGRASQSVGHRRLYDGPAQDHS